MISNKKNKAEINTLLKKLKKETRFHLSIEKIEKLTLHGKILDFDDAALLSINTRIKEIYGVSIIHEVPLEILHPLYLELYSTMENNICKKFNLKHMSFDADYLIERTFKDIKLIHDDLKYCIIFYLINGDYIPNTEDYPLSNIDGIEDNLFVLKASYRIAFLTQCFIFDKIQDIDDIIKRDLVDISIDEFKIATEILKKYLETIEL
jgi:hypothetical protein